MNKTRLFSDTISVTDVEGLYSLPVLKKFSIINLGANDCDVNMDNDIADSDREKFIAYQSVPYNFGSGFTTLHHKAASGKTATLQIVGQRMVKE